MKKRMLCTLMALVLICLVPLGCAAARDFRIPDFASYARREILETEKYDGMTYYTLSRKNWSKVLGAYAELLENDYGFIDIQRNKGDSVYYVWFADHSSVQPEKVNNDVMSGTCAILFAYAEMEDGNIEVTVVPCDGFEKADTGERYGDSPKPTAKPTKKPSVQCSVCDGTGKCQHCGGDGWYMGFKWVTKHKWKNGVYQPVTENVSVHEICDDKNCDTLGNCKVCGGDGWRD